MIKYIIVNTNANRETFNWRKYDCTTGQLVKQTAEYLPPFFLRGMYVANSDGNSHHDITRAHVYSDKKPAQKQADKLNKKFAVRGDYFSLKAHGYRYPDSVQESGYGKFAPEYKVVKVQVTMTECT